MKINTQSPLIVLLISLIFFFLCSCSTDFDLLKDYVLTDVRVVDGKNVVDDTFMVTHNGIAVLDVLSNDGFTAQDSVSIKETSSPTNGSVVINTNNTITYTPSTIEETPVSADEPSVAEEAPPVLAEESPIAVEEPPIAGEEPPVMAQETLVTDSETVDTFTYTTEVVNEDQSITTEEGTVTVVIAPENQAPIAVATANFLTGNAPLTVAFSGENSSDDINVVSYGWGFPGNSSSASNATHTFNDPGVYDVTLTVTDEAGLEDTAILTITVSQESLVGQIPCSVGGGKAGETGSKIWCWENIDLPEYSGSKGPAFTNGELTIDSECNEQQVTKVGNQLKFRVNPTTPEAGSWCEEDFNMRAEVRTSPWQVNHPSGTEEWFGWSYTLGNDYIIDKHNQWLFWQVHHGVVGDSPHTEIMVIKDGQFSGHSAGEIYIANGADSPHYIPTGITPKAGDKLDIVVHAVWDTGSNGLLQVWINGQNVYDGQVATVYASSPWGGNAKWGIYKWPWREESGVQKSLQQGITHLETYMGTLRQITRRPGEPDYLKNSYSMVAPN